jgi:hypothetical protein
MIWDRCCSVKGVVGNLEYWNEWDGTLVGESLLPISVNLFVIAVGISAAWKRWKVAGIAPLVINLSYTLSNALVRNSGGRFNLPADWVGYLYYGIGLIQLCSWGLMFFRNRFAPAGISYADTSPESPLGTERYPLKHLVVTGLLLFLLSAAIPFGEKAIPERFRGQDVWTILSGLDERGLLGEYKIDARLLEQFLAQDQAEALFGRGLYPRYYSAGRGEPGTGWPDYTPREYSRLGFYLVGPVRRHVVLRLPTAPSYFPNASDVLVLGCSAEDYLDAYLVIHLASPEVIQVRSPMEVWTCPGLE